MNKTVRTLVLLALSVLVTITLFASVTATVARGADLNDAIETSIRAAHAIPAKHA